MLEHKDTDGGGIVPGERRRLIVDRVRGAGSVTVAALESEFGISSMTARRDLSALEREGLVRRTHGGAMLPSLARHEDSFQRRLEQATEQKLRLAAAAVELVAEGESIFVDSSTTAYFAAQRILESGLRVTLLTNSVPLIELVTRADAPQVQLVGVGGSLRRLTQSFVGPEAIAAVRSRYADKLLLSVKGVAPGGLMTDPDPLEAEVKAAMIAHVRDAILLADASKFEGTGLSVIGHVSTLGHMLAADVPESGIAEMTEAGVDVRPV